MQAVTTIGLDIAKSVFQIHGIEAAGNVIVRRRLKRRYVLPFFQKLPPCLVGIEASASSHHWLRELQAGRHLQCPRRLTPTGAPCRPLPPMRISNMVEYLAASARRNYQWKSTRSVGSQPSSLVESPAGSP